jgi:hypothetical protein
VKLATTTTVLVPYLFDLLAALAGKDISLMLVGGFALILRQEHLKATAQPTLITRLPPARATDDLDVMLGLELLANIEKTQMLRDVFDALGYQAVVGREFFQFKKQIDDHFYVKVDLLTPEPPVGDRRFKIDKHRVRPRIAPTSRIPKPDLHAFGTAEAIAVYDQPLSLLLEGHDSAGQQQQGNVEIPHPYAFLLLKLLAFSDWERDKTGENQLRFSRKHASDIYGLVASITQAEDDQLAGFVARYATHPIAQQAAEIVAALFASPTSLGVLRVQEQLGGLTATEISVLTETLGRTFVLAQQAQELRLGY